jgi:polyisoprenyl-phosphate glycosyltransferase
MDCDLQDPPEVIRDLYAQTTAGAEIVLARRGDRATAGWRRLASRAYFGLLNAVSDTPIDGSLGALTMFSRRVRERYLAMTEPDRHHVMVLQWLGFQTATITYRQDSRKGGRSAYRLSTLIDSAITGLFFNSSRLLRYVIYVGFACALAGFTLGILLTIRRLMAYTAPGWTGLIVAQLTIGGLIIMCVGAVGLYVGRVFEQVRGRPLFIIDEDSDRAARVPPGTPGA